MVRRHMAYSYFLKKGSPGYEKRFSRSTPSNTLSAFTRIWDPELGPNAGAPLGRRIEQDVSRCFGDHILEIIKAKGCAVQGIGSRSGHRAIIFLDHWGGHRLKKDYEGGKWIHPDIKEPYEAQLKKMADES